MVRGGTSVIITRARTAFQLRRTDRGSLYLDGSVGQPGVLDVPPVAGAPLVSLLVDTGAHISVMGAGGKRHLKDWLPHQRRVRGVGGIAVGSYGAGVLDVSFRTPAGGLWSAGKALTVLGEAFAVKLLHGDHSSRPRAAVVLQAACVRAVEAVKPRKGRELRACAGVPLSKVADVVARLGITSPRVLRKLSTFMDGVVELTVPDAAPLDSALRRACMKRTSTRRERTALSVARDKPIPKGRRWYVDITPRMPVGIDGKRYGVIFIEHLTRYIIVFYVIDKSTDSFVYALRQLVIFVKSHLPSAFQLDMHGDSGRAWTSRGGETTACPQPWPSTSRRRRP
jgi:hypothetical protein